MKHLQVAIQLDTDRKASNGYEVNVTPVDVALPDSIAIPLQGAIAIGDIGDAQPGDGEYDAGTRLKFPVRINLFITELKTSVDVDANVVLRVVEKP